jgi:hypothetical protein
LIEIGQLVLEKNILEFFFLLFSSSELKAQVSFSDLLLSVVCLSVHPSVRLLTFHIFYFFPNFNKTWHITLGKGIQVCSNEVDIPSPREDNSKRVKNTDF